MKFYAKPELALSDLEAGALDLALILSPLDQPRLAKVPTLTTQFIPSVAIYAVLFNAAAVKDKRVRQAAYYAINRAEIVKSVLNGQARVLIGPPGFKDYSDLNKYDFNPDKAKQLLKDAGYDASKPLRWSYDQSQPFLSTLMPIFQQQLQAVGFNVVLDPLDTTAYIAKVTSGPENWDITMQIGNSEGLGPARTGDELPANCKTHPWGYANCALDELFVKGRSTTVPDQRDAFYHQAALILNDEVPELYLWSPFNLDAYPKTLGGGFAIHPNDRETMMDIETWTLGQ
jgi:peptide/nickel transport system substrate-binding protein